MAFEKGNTVNLDRKLSEETKKKMSLSHKDKRPSEWGAGFKKGNIPWNKNLEIRAYFAGLIDGEGSIMLTINRTPNPLYKKLCVAVGMRSDKAQPLTEGYKIWGGSLNKRQPRKSNWHEVLDWRLWTNSAEKFLKDIRPFLRIKGEQAELALRYRWLQTRKRSGTNQISEKEWQLRKELEDKLKELNS